MAKSIVVARDRESAKRAAEMMELDDLEMAAVRKVINESGNRYPSLHKLVESGYGPDGDVTFTPPQLAFLREEIAAVHGRLALSDPRDVVLSHGRARITVARVEEVLAKLAEIVRVATVRHESVFGAAD